MTSILASTTGTTSGSMDVFKCKWGETPKLTQLNYHQWRPDMELFLGAEEALLIVIEAEEYPEEGDDSDVSSWNKRIAKGAAMINAACHASVKPYIRHITDARKMWKTLAEKLDTTATRAGRCSLLRQFHALRPTMSSKSPYGVSEYINQLTEFSNRLEGSEQAISDETFIAHLTTTLPETFRNIIDIILHQPPEDQTLPKVVSTLIEWEQSEETRRTATRLNQPNPSTVPAISTALNAETRTSTSFSSHYRPGGSFHRGKLTRFRQRVGKSWSRPQGNRFQRGRGYRSGAERECWYCGKRGHIQKDCFKRKDQGNWRNERKPNNTIFPLPGNGSTQADLAVVQALTTAASTNIVPPPPQFFHSQVPIPVLALQHNQPWIIDSGASHSLTPHKTLFNRLDPLEEDVAVTVGNGDTIKALGRGTITLVFGFGLTIAIEALYVPGIRRSLLSVSQLNNYTPLTFRNGYCYGGSVAIGILQDGLYELLATAVPTRRSYCEPNSALDSIDMVPTSFVSTLPSLKMWHLRLGHLGLDALKKLVPAISYSNSEENDLEVRNCVTCIQAKQQRAYNRRPVEKTTTPFHLLHSDLCGPLIPSHSGYWYFILYIDDFSRTAWVYFLRSKRAEEVVSVFQEFQAMVDTQYPQYTIRRFRCDNGRGEYDNAFFRGILRVRGISFEPSPPYTQHKNGVSERMIRTITTKARSLLLDSRLEDIFWAEAVNTATYLHSRSPSSSLNHHTPYEILTGRKPELQHLRRFGSTVHKLIPQEQRNGKFSSRSRKCLMLGYVHDTTKVWRLWDTVESRVIQASNVRFDETLMEGKRIVDEQTKDTLQELEDTRIAEGAEYIEDDDLQESMARSSGLLTKVETKAEEAKHAIEVQSHHTLLNEKAFDIVDPKSYEEALSCGQHTGWKKAMREEFAALKANDTWNYVPAGNEHAIRCRWVFRTKVNADSSTRLKARLVIKGYEQVEGIDYSDTYTPVAKLASFRLLLALASGNGWLIHHMDVVSAFLNPPVDEEIYMDPPEGIEWLENSWRKDNELVCKLKKSLYGLKQAPRLWHRHIDTFLKTLGFTSTNSDCHIYISNTADMIILLYVDDLLIFALSLSKMQSIKAHLSEKYQMTDLGSAKQFLGIELNQIQHLGIEYWTISQQRFIKTVLSRFGMLSCKGVTTPLDQGKLLSKAHEEYKSTLTTQQEYQKLIGSLMYLMMGTRPDLAYTLSTLSKFNCNPTSDHLLAAKRVLRYIQSTAKLHLAFTAGTELNLELKGFCDSDWAGDKSDSKSTSGYLFKLSGAAICWKSRKQNLIALSSTEAEYIALTEAAKEASWLRELYQEICLRMNLNKTMLQGSIPIYADNQAAIQMAKVPRFHERTKHIRIRYHYVRSAIESNIITLDYIPTTANPADILTKALSRNLHESHLLRLGLCYFP